MVDHSHINKLTREIESALAPGQFIRYGDMFDFIENLEKFQEKLSELAAGGEATQAVRLYELFLSGCYEKMEECDDSGGNMGMFWDSLFCDWVKARQKAGCPAVDTVAQILKWKENDSYGLCFENEKEVAKVLDREGYQLFVAHFQSIVKKALAEVGDKQTRPIFEHENDLRLPAISLKYIYQAKCDAFERSRQALAHRFPHYTHISLPGFSPVMREAQKFKALPLAGLCRRVERYQPRLFRLDRQPVFLKTLTEHLVYAPRILFQFKPHHQIVREAYQKRAPAQSRSFRYVRVYQPTTTHVHNLPP